MFKLSIYFAYVLISQTQELQFDHLVEQTYKYTNTMIQLIYKISI